RHGVLRTFYVTRGFGLKISFFSLAAWGQAGGGGQPDFRARAGEDHCPRPGGARRGEGQRRDPRVGAHWSSRAFSSERRAAASVAASSSCFFITCWAVTMYSTASCGSSVRCMRSTSVGPMV